MASSLQRQWNVTPLAIMAAICGICVMEVFASGPLGYGRPVALGEAIAYLALAGVSIAAALVALQAGFRQVVAWLALGTAFALLCIGAMAGLARLWPRFAADHDIPILISWVMIGLALVPALRHSSSAPISRALLLAGFVLQSLALVLDLGAASWFQAAVAWTRATLSVADVCGIVGLGAYQSGLALILLSMAGADPAGGQQSLAARAGEAVSDWLNSGPVRHISIAVEEIKCRWWRMRHPDADYARYYADRIVARLDRGKGHPSLGRRLWKKSVFEKPEGEWSEDAFARRGLEQFEKVKSLGITPASIVIDYGCGSLRIGQHFIRCLDPGRFWGLDVTDRFYNDGLALLEAGLAAQKQPHLHVIDDETLEAARNASPDIIYSHAVMMHVPEGELEIFWQRMLSLMAPHTIAAVHFQEAARNMRSSGRTWAYTESCIAGLIRKVMPAADIRFEPAPRKTGLQTSWRPSWVIISSRLSETS